jgi:hypothetical protein
MRSKISTGLACSIVVAVIASAPHAAQDELRHFAWVQPASLDSDSVEQLFTLYESGRYTEFDRIVGTLPASFLNPFEFEADAERWIGDDPERRAFVAAAVALELASRQLRLDTTRPGGAETNTIRQMNFVLAEVGCALLRDYPPSPIELQWHVAFVGLARRIGSFSQINAPPALRPPMGRGNRRGPDLFERQRKEHGELMRRLRQRASRVSRSTRIDSSRLMADHGSHVLARFPGDPVPGFIDALIRDNGWASPFVHETLLASRHSPVWLQPAQVDEVIKRGARQVRGLPPNVRTDRQSADRLLRISPEVNACIDRIHDCTPPQGAAAWTVALWRAVDAFGAVTREPVAAEAYIHQGQNYVRLAQPVAAIGAFARAEMLATTPYELYLARLFAGAAMARIGRHDEAIVAFRGALQAVPRAQSASFALAQLLLTKDARDEAAVLLEATMKLPLVDDPLQFYVLGDPLAVPRAFARIRQGLRR